MNRLQIPAALRAKIDREIADSESIQWIDQPIVRLVTIDTAIMLLGGVLYVSFYFPMIAILDSVPGDKSCQVIRVIILISLITMQDPEEAAAYLALVLDDGDPEHILLALNNVAEARSLLSNPPDRSNQNWQEIYPQFIQQKSQIFPY